MPLTLSGIAIGNIGWAMHGFAKKLWLAMGMAHPMAMAMGEKKKMRYQKGRARRHNDLS